jgi:basic membrane protein A
MGEKMIRILRYLPVFMVLPLLLVSCSKHTASPSGSHPIKAAVVTDVGGIGDLSFNAMAWEGLKRAGKELGIGIKFLESKEQADYAPNLRKFAEQGYDIVFAVGFLMEDAVRAVAPKYPKTKFVIIDGNAPKCSNAAALKFREEEGCFLAGALAGAMTKTGKIGFIGGMEVPLIKKFECGYKAGAMTTRPDVKVLTAYTGRWDDPAKGAELAMSQFGQGADIVMHASGSCGLGVINAAKTKGPGFYAIGVDADQDYIAPGRVLTSMMKRVDNAVYLTCKSVVDGTFKPGDHVFGLKEEGVGLSPLKYTKKDVPSEVLSKISKLREMIITGELNPPKTLEELRRFKPPVL